MPTTEEEEPERGHGQRGKDKGPRQRRTCVKCRSSNDPQRRAFAADCPGRTSRGTCDEAKAVIAMVEGEKKKKQKNVIAEDKWPALQKTTPQNTMPQPSPTVWVPTMMPVWMPVQMPFASPMQQQQSQAQQTRESQPREPGKRGKDRGPRKSRTCITCSDSDDPEIQKGAGECPGKNARGKCPHATDESEDERDTQAKKARTERSSQNSASIPDNQQQQSSTHTAAAAAAKPAPFVPMPQQVPCMPCVGPSMQQQMFFAQQQMQQQWQRQIGFAAQQQMQMKRQMAMQMHAFQLQQQQQQQQQTKEQGKESGGRGPDIIKRKSRTCVTCRASEDENIRLQADKCPGRGNRERCPNKTASNTEVSSTMPNYVSF